MKNRPFHTIAYILFLYVLGFGKIDFQYTGIGAGGQISLAVSHDHSAAFGFGFQGIVKMDLGTIGIIHYNPSLCFWFNSSTKNPTTTIEIEYRNRQTAFNPFDAKYLIPVPKSLFFLPYAGGGLCIIFDGWEKESKETGAKTTRISGKKVHGGFNLFCGLNFPFSEVFVPFVETRFTTTNNWVLKLTSGITFQF